MVPVVVTVGWGSGTTLVCTFVIVWEVSEEGARQPGDGSEGVKLHEAFAFGHTPGGSWWCGGKYLHLIHTIPRTCETVTHETPGKSAARKMSARARCPPQPACPRTGWTARGPITR